MTKAIAKIPKKLSWGGLIPRPANTQEAGISMFCNQVAKIYGVPSMGVNAMGNQPYLNKDGRLYLLNALRKGRAAVKAIRKEFIQLSKSLDEAAIVKTTIVFQNGVEVEAIGEASKDSVKLDAVKKTLNMMAETRSLNRAIWQAIAGDVWERVDQNLAKADMSESQRIKVAQAGQVSYEEVQGQTEVIRVIKTEKSDPVILAEEFIAGARSDKSLKTAAEKIKNSPDFSEENRKYLLGLVTKKLKELGYEV